MRSHIRLHQMWRYGECGRAARLVEPSNGFRGSVPSFRVVATCAVSTRSAFLRDAVRLGPLHVRDGVIRLMTEKTGERVFAPRERRLGRGYQGRADRRHDLHRRGRGKASRQRSVHQHVPHLGEGGGGQQVPNTVRGKQGQPRTRWTVTATPSFRPNSDGPAGIWPLCTRGQRSGATVACGGAADERENEVPAPYPKKRGRVLKNRGILVLVVPLAGIEPALLAESDFESDASTSSAIGARAKRTGPI